MCRKTGWNSVAFMNLKAGTSATWARHGSPNTTRPANCWSSILTSTRKKSNPCIVLKVSFYTLCPCAGIHKRHTALRVAPCSYTLIQIMPHASRSALSSVVVHVKIQVLCFLPHVSCLTLCVLPRGLTRWNTSFMPDTLLVAPCSYRVRTR